MNHQRIREIEQFLYGEARLLDQRRFHEWIELLTDDVRKSRAEKLFWTRLSCWPKT